MLCLIYRLNSACYIETSTVLYLYFVMAKASLDTLLVMQLDAILKDLLLYILFTDICMFYLLCTNFCRFCMFFSFCCCYCKIFKILLFSFSVTLFIGSRVCYCYFSFVLFYFFRDISPNTYVIEAVGFSDLSMILVNLRKI